MEVVDTLVNVNNTDNSIKHEYSHGNTENAARTTSAFGTNRTYNDSRAEEKDEVPRPAVRHALLASFAEISHEAEQDVQQDSELEGKSGNDSDSYRVGGDDYDHGLAANSSNGKQLYEYVAPAEHWQGHPEFAYTYENDPLPGWRREIKV